MNDVEQPRLASAVGLYMEGIRDGKPEEALKKYTGAVYKQHSTGVPDGQEGFLKFFSSFLERNPERKIELVRGWEDGKYVFVHVYQSLNGGKAQWVTADFFDTDENCKLIEHWDVIAEFNASNPSGRSNVDGDTEIRDLDKTEENKAVVRACIENLLMRGGDVSKPDTYISPEKYIQHNPGVGDGLEHFAKLISAPDRALWYDRIVLCVGRGNFVATLCETSWNEQKNAQVDIFRLENGRIVEHWDAVEPCPPEDELANSGKF